MRPILATQKSWGLLTCQIALGLTVLTAGVAVGGVAWGIAGLRGLAAAGIAAASCWLGAALALEATVLLARRGQGLTGLLAGTALRMGIPLALALGFHFGGGPLAQGGLLYYFLAFYPLTLAAETAMSLPRAGTPSPPANLP
jgi:hypothetical protein